MKNKTRFTFSIILAIMFIFTAFVTAGAVSGKDNAVSRFHSFDRKLLCISHRGDTALYPENSLEAVKSAFEKGADFVSVSLDKTKDGVFCLCERESLGNVCNAPYESLSEASFSEVSSYRLFDIYGNETEYRLTSLEALLKNTDSNDGLILDILPEDKDSVYDVLSENKALDRVIDRKSVV